MNRPLLYATLAATLACASTAANATDNYTAMVDAFSGAQCQPSNGSQWSDFTINPDGLRNDHPTQNRYISCTMLARNMQGISQADGNDPSTSQGAFWFWVYFDYSQVPTASLTYTTTCTVFAKRMDTGTTSSESFNTSSIRTTSPVYNVIEPTSFDGYTSNLFAAYSFNCRLPPKVKLYGFSQVTFGDAGGYRWVP